MMELSWGLPGAMPTRLVLRAPLGAGWELQCIIAAPRARPSLGFAQAVAPMNFQGKALGGSRLVTTSASCSAVRRCGSCHWSTLVSPCWKSPDLPPAVSLLCKGVAIRVVLPLAIACTPCGEQCQQTWSCWQITAPCWAGLGLSLGTCYFSGV